MLTRAAQERYQARDYNCFAYDPVYGVRSQRLLSGTAPDTFELVSLISTAVERDSAFGMREQSDSHPHPFWPPVEIPREDNQRTVIKLEVAKIAEGERIKFENPPGWHSFPHGYLSYSSSLP